MIHPNSTFDAPNHRRNRRGVVMVVLVVAVAVCLTLFGVWAQAAVREHQRLANQQLRLQATRLAEAGLQRAIVRRTADPQYEQETWAVPAEHLGGVHAAQVRLGATSTDDAAAIRYEATAQYPAGVTRRAQITRRIEIPHPTSGDEP